MKTYKKTVYLTFKVVIDSNVELDDVILQETLNDFDYDLTYPEYMAEDINFLITELHHFETKD